MQRILCPTPPPYASFIIHRQRCRNASFLQHKHHKHNHSPSNFFGSTIIPNHTSSLSSLSSSSSMDKTVTPKLPTYITFLTDVEGDGLYFDRFIHHSQILGFRSITPSFGRYAAKIQNDDDDDDDGLEQRCRSSGDDERDNEGKWNYGQHDEEYFPYDKEVVFLIDKSILVYGGDVWDKGGMDLYVMRQLLSLRRRYPDRVHFLMGNRDINKMRIVDELGGINASSLPKHEGVYWLLRGLLPTAQKPSIPTNTADRLKWMLSNTMGSINAFESRRDELKRERIAIMNQTSVTPSLEVMIRSTMSSATVSDEEVAQSYICSCCPISGILGQYLMHAKLVIRFGSVLFLHGALPIDSKIDADDKFNHFPTPWLLPGNESSAASRVNSLTEWIGALNGFASSQVEAWKEFARHPQDIVLNSSADAGVWATQGGYFNNTAAGKMFGALMQYGMGRLSDNATTQSCVYSSWMHNGLPRDDIFGCDKSMTIFSKLLKKEGIQIILTGHRPVGDAPWPIRIPQHVDGQDAPAWVLLCDTSFSGDTQWTTIEGFESIDSKSQGRGLAKSSRGEVAFSEPLIRLCPTTGNVDLLKIHGCLSDGSFYESENMMTINDDKDDLVCGKSQGPAIFEDKESGRSREGMFWVKSRVDDKILVSFGEGYNVWNSFIPEYPRSTTSSAGADET